MLREVLYESVQPLLEKTADRLHHFGITPNHLTFSGLGLNAIGCWLYSGGHWSLGGLVVLFAGTFDMLDGTLARRSGQATRFGAFLDSVIDRYSDMLIFGGILLYAIQEQALGWAVLSLLALSGALLTSYTRARAENFIPDCRVGLVERPERIMVIGVGTLVGLVEPALWILAATTNWTAVQRIRFTLRKLEGT